MKRSAGQLILGAWFLLACIAVALAQAQPRAADEAIAIFAGGCFWCVEADFDKVPGVVSTTSGYIGGTVPNPTYEQVSAGGTGHAEAVRIAYDPSRVSYEDLLKVFWHNVDPLTANAQFCDVGSQYRSAIFYLDARQKQLAGDSMAAVARRFAPRRIATEIVPATEFYPAEEYHQDFHRKHELKYEFYRWNCGRDARLKELWGSEAGGPKGS